MAKKAEKDDGGYLWFKATVDCGELTFRYRLKDAVVDGGETHDEDVEDWSDDDIKNSHSVSLTFPSTW